MTRVTVFDFNGHQRHAPSRILHRRFDADAERPYCLSLCLFDSNEAGVLSGQQFFPPGAFYKLDTQRRRPPTLVAAPLTLPGTFFAYYIVDATRLKLLRHRFFQQHSPGGVAQPIISFTAASLNSGFAFLIGGSGVTGRLPRPAAQRGRAGQPDFDFHR